MGAAERAVARGRVRRARGRARVRVRRAARCSRRPSPSRSCPPCWRRWGSEGAREAEAATAEGATSSAAVVGAALLAAYPPRGRLDLLPRLGPDGRPPPWARSDRAWRPAHALSGWAFLCAEDAVADTARSFDGDRVQCARRLALALPHIPLASAPVEIEFEVAGGEEGANEASGKTTVAATPVAGAEALLAETLLAAMVRPPAPDLKPLAYSALLVDCCRALPTAFPRAMSGCVRELFARCGALDPYVCRAAADWLAYHLSNFEFAWPWAKWESAVLPSDVVPAHDPKRRFVARLIDDLVRLSYWERVRSALPESFHELMPPQPAVAPLDDEDEHAEDAGREEGEGTSPSFRLDAVAAREVLDLARRKAPPSALNEWAAARASSGTPGATLVVSAVHALLVAGAKSFTHMVTVLERYHDFLAPLISSSCGLDGSERGETAALRAVEQAWGAAPQRGAQAVDRLMAARLVSGASVVRWALSSRGFLSLPSSASPRGGRRCGRRGGADAGVGRPARRAGQARGAGGGRRRGRGRGEGRRGRRCRGCRRRRGGRGRRRRGRERGRRGGDAAALRAAAGNAAAAPLRAAAAAALELADLKAQEHARALETQRAALALALTMMRDALARADAPPPPPLRHRPRRGARRLEGAHAGHAPRLRAEVPRRDRSHRRGCGARRGLCRGRAGAGRRARGGAGQPRDVTFYLRVFFLLSPFLSRSLSPFFR